MKTIVLITILFLNIYVKSFAQAPPQNIQNEIAEWLNDTKQGLLQQNNVEVPGWMIRVEKVGQWQQTWVNGVSETTNNTPLTGTEKFRIGNISQTFLAVAVLKLVQNNQLQLSDPITSWLPISITSLIPNAANITIKNLLQHTSGIAGYNEAIIENDELTAPAILIDWYNSNFLNNYTFSQIMNNYFTLYQPIALPSNNSYNYSETNYLLIGQIIENCSGFSWQQYVQQNIIAPFNLVDTSCIIDGTISNPTNFLNGYVYFEDENGVYTPFDVTVQNNSIYKGSRGMISSLNDLIIFWKNLRQNNILPSDLTTLLLTCNAFPFGDTTSFGVGLGCFQPNQGFDWIGNEGNIEGYSSAMYYLPSIDTYVSVVNNRFATTNQVIIAGIEYIISQNNLSLNDNSKPDFLIKTDLQKNQLTISASEIISEIQLYDISGKKIFSKQNSNQLDEIIDITTIKSGIYIIKIKANNKVMTKKIKI